MINKAGVLMAIVLFSAAGFYSCGDSTVTPVKADNVSFSGMSSVDSIGDFQNTLVLDTVKILVKDIKLELANSSEDSSDFKVGPFVLFSDFTSGITTLSSAIIPAGTYKKIKFEVHKLEDAEAVPDPEFADINGRYSVIIKGTYLGVYFVYKSTKSAHQKLEFPNTVPITASGLTNITMVVKPYIWFIKNGVYMNPFDPANSNDIDNNIKDNIKNNFKAFKDDDKNGSPD